MTDILGSAGANAALEALAKSYGITPEQLDAVVEKVVPALSNRIERNTLSRGGLSDLVAEFARPAHVKALTDPNFAASPAAIDAGNHALDTIFGNKATSRNIAAQTAVSSGIQQAIIQKLLPIIASMVMAALAKNTQGGLGDILKKLPDIMGGGGGGMPQSPAPSRRRQAEPEPQNPDLGGLGDILSKIPGFPGTQQTGQPLPAPTRTAHAPQPQHVPQPSGDTGFGGAGGGDQPLPIPGDRIPGINAPNDSPFGNLPDVIRQGGQSVNGRSLGDVVRDQVGSSLGFPKSGFLSWIIRLIIMRWGWGLVTGILRRLLTGR
ncbi:MAG: DUF937 domain-containing protein [Hyphomicrobiaceae bacterium]